MERRCERLIVREELSSPIRLGRHASNNRPLGGCVRSPAGVRYLYHTSNRVTEEAVPMSATASNVTQPATKQPATSAPRSTAILAVVSLIQLMVIVDTTVVNIALPSIKTALDFSQVDLQWVINAYTL